MTKITRFEYIGPNGREISIYDGEFEYDLQDGVRTLKVFGSKVAVSSSKARDLSIIADTIDEVFVERDQSGCEFLSDEILKEMAHRILEALK